MLPNELSTTKLAIQKPNSKDFFVPYIIEPSAGLDRGVLAILVDAYRREKLDDGNERVVLKIKPSLAPIKVAVIPLARNNADIVSVAKKTKQTLQALGIGRIRYEDTGNIGKAYRRNDEIGTPLCITVDFETLEKSPQTVTVRNRDSREQQRIALEDLPTYIQTFFQD